MFGRPFAQAMEEAHIFPAERLQYAPLVIAQSPAMLRRKNICLFIFVFLSTGHLSPVATTAQSMPIPAAPTIGAKSYLVIDADSGYKLASLQPDLKRAPASLTKLMTAYVIFKALQEDQVRLDDKVTVSEKAWRTSGSKMFIEVGKRVSLQDLILGMIVQSGNDASVALAEHVAGTESVFAEVDRKSVV